MRHLTFFAFFAFLLWPPGKCNAQDRYAEFTAAIQRLYAAKGQADIDEAWSGLVSSHRVPLVAGDSVAFLYRGPARTVAWLGDFNGWGQSKTFTGKAARVPGTDLWILRASLPADARLDYKILIDGDQQILDPVNPATQWSGVGGGSLNSELRMPEWQENPITTHPLPGSQHGHIDKDLLFDSRELGYQITYSVYTPPSFDPARAYPIIYATDGYEYMHDRMGNMPTVLDNLIHEGKIEPVVVIFVDHREPVNRSNNRRMKELAMNERFSNFLCRELVPRVEQGFTHDTNVRRAIIGTSIGGLTATWLSFTHPDVFDRAAAQSPAFWFNPEIYALCARSTKAPTKFFLSAGLIHDVEDATRKMREIFDRVGCPYSYQVSNQGQSWGNWRDQIDDMLVYLFPRNPSE